jgi:hypothetical protein
MDLPEGYVPQIRLAPEAPPEGKIDDDFWLDVREHVGAWLVRAN